MEEQVDRVLVRNEATLGYSTCFWHTVRGSILLEDPRGWFAGLQERCHWTTRTSCAGTSSP